MGSQNQILKSDISRYIEEKSRFLEVNDKKTLNLTLRSILIIIIMVAYLLLLT